MQIPICHQFQSTSTNYKIALNFSNSSMLLLIGNVNLQSTELINDVIFLLILLLKYFVGQVGLQTQSIPPELVKAAFGRSVEVGLPHFLHLYLFSFFSKVSRMVAVEPRKRKFHEVSQRVG